MNELYVEDLASHDGPQGKRLELNGRETRRLYPSEYAPLTTIQVGAAVFSA